MNKRGYIPNPHFRVSLSGASFLYWIFVHILCKKLKICPMIPSIMGCIKMRFKQFSFKIPLEEKEILLTFESEINKQKGNKNKAFRQTLKDNIAMKTAIFEKDKEVKDLTEKLRYAEDYASGKSKQFAPPQISEKACDALGHKKNGEPICMNPNALISTQARRHFNHEVCTFCLKQRNKQLNEDKKKQEEEIKRFHEQKKREVHDLQKSVNETVNKQNSSKGYFTNEYGTRIPY